MQPRVRMEGPALGQVSALVLMGFLVLHVKLVCPPLSYTFLFFSPFSIPSSFLSLSFVNEVLALCSMKCLNGGLCIAKNKCNCTVGWKGADCSQRMFFL